MAAEREVEVLHGGPPLVFPYFEHMSDISSSPPPVHKSARSALYPWAIGFMLLPLLAAAVGFMLPGNGMAVFGLIWGAGAAAVCWPVGAILGVAADIRTTRMRAAASTTSSQQAASSRYYLLAGLLGLAPITMAPFFAGLAVVFIAATSWPWLQTALLAVIWGVSAFVPVWLARLGDKQRIAARPGSRPKAALLMTVLQLILLASAITDRV